MGRPPRHPGLQEKFNRFVNYFMSGKDVVTSSVLIEATRNHYDFTSEEKEDLDKNFVNYVARAKSLGILESNGQRRGYSLRGDLSLTPKSDNGDRKELKVAVSQWEGFFHFSASIALSELFQAKVKSLPKSVDSVKWGNPDILMIRSSSFADLEYASPADSNRKIDLSLLRKVDATPACVLSSIELKFNLLGSRSAWFQAVSEAAANSRWANEGWLLFIDIQKDDSYLDEVEIPGDALSLARSVEIGVIEMKIIKEGDFHRMITKIHQQAPLRTTLRLEEMNPKDRYGLLYSAQDLIAEWDKSVDEFQTYLDGDGPEDKIRILLEDSIKNLKIQTGFSGDKIKEQIDLLSVNANNPRALKAGVSASLAQAAFASGFLEAKNIFSEFEKIISNTYGKTVANEYISIFSLLWEKSEFVGRAS